jgi:hypothetical protein
MNPTTELTETFVIGFGIGLIGVCLAVHAFFMFLVLKAHTVYLRTYPRAHGARLLVPATLLATGIIAVSSFIQIVTWAVVLKGSGGVHDLRDALHFSATTFTTLGTTRLEIKPPFRSLEPLEATNGLLANGLNAAILFAIMASLGRRHSGFDEFFR